MLVQTRLPRRTYLVARLEYGSQPRARPSPHQTEMTAVIACHQLEDRILTLVNRERQSAGIKPLYFSPELARAARYHSSAMADAGFAQVVVSIPPGQEHAIEDWGRIRRAFA